MPAASSSWRSADTLLARIQDEAQDEWDRAHPAFDYGDLTDYVEPRIWCQYCDREFTGENGRSVHLAKKHGIRGQGR